MKFLFLMLILLIAAPPVQAGYCAMEAGQGPMEAPQESPGDSDSDGHDCCPKGKAPAAPDETPGDVDCSAGAHCNACFLVAAALPENPAPPSAVPGATCFSSIRGLMAPSHSHPPFRPPIA